MNKLTTHDIRIKLVSKSKLHNLLYVYITQLNKRSKRPEFNVFQNFISIE